MPWLAVGLIFGWWSYEPGPRYHSFLPIVDASRYGGSLRIPDISGSFWGGSGAMLSTFL